MIRPCPNPECSAQFADDLRACPICNTPNVDVVAELAFDDNLPLNLRIGRQILIGYLVGYILLELSILVLTLQAVGLVALRGLITRTVLTYVVGRWLYNGSPGARNFTIFICAAGGFFLMRSYLSRETGTGIYTFILALFYLSFAAVLLLPTNVRKFLLYQREHEA